MIRFSVEDWAAWAPGVETRQSWQAWAADPFIPQGDHAPALTEIPAMQRRRIEALGRMAIQVACWCEQPDDAGSVPMIFASRHGDVARSMGLLQSLVTEQPLSPTGFGLSVHNAVAALYSITRQSRANYLAVAAGRATVQTALIEAAALLQDGAGEVRLVIYDAHLPEVYSTFNDRPDACVAWCWRIKPATGRAGDFQLSWNTSAQKSEKTARDALPPGLSLMHFVLTDTAHMMQLDDGDLRWTLSRHD